MITEDYVSFETAKLLKEKGFDEKCRALYTFWFNEEVEGPKEDRAENWNVEQRYFSAPTLQMAMKWLREVHHLTVDIFHFRDWKVIIKTIPDDYFKADYSYPELKPSETYEQACEAAIRYSLEKLI